MNSRPLIVALLLLAVAGCGTPAPTPYQPSTLGGGYGYGERRIEPGRWRVWFTANGATPRDTLQNYVLYRAAEVTLAHGGDYFVVVERNTSPDYGGTGGTTVGIGGGGGSRSGMGVGIGIGLPLSGDRGMLIASAEITIHRGAKPGGARDTYDARAVRQGLRTLVPQG